MSSGLSEFELIERYFRQLGERSSHVTLGVGDDCAIISPPSDKDLCLSIDTLVEGVHFPKNCAPDAIGYRALATALSDLAAMGAEPSHFTLALTLPDTNDSWIRSFSEGLSGLASEHGVELAGGDTTRGPLTVSIQVHGFVSKNKALKRSGAEVGHVLCVSGMLGDAGAGLELLDVVEPTSEQIYLLDRYYRPSARVEEGQLLSSFASSCIDISDGLLADANHIAALSNVKLEIDQGAIPLSSALRSEFESRAIDFALGAGDDYELLFTLKERDWIALQQDFPQFLFSKIGQVLPGEGVSLIAEGAERVVGQKGYKHFE